MAETAVTPGSTPTPSRPPAAARAATRPDRPTGPPSGGPTPAPVGVDPHHARRWWILGVLGIAQLMVVLDATVVTIALPAAQRALAFSDGQRQWVVTGYALAFGSLLLIGGRLADLLGRRRMFLLGLVGFAAASALGGASTGFGMLVTARAVQGAFAALLAPAGLALLTTTFTSPEERGQAFGVYGAIGGAGAAVGLLLGGLLTEYASWRWTMFVNVGFAGVALLGGAAWLRHVTSSDEPRLDVPGTLTVSAGLFSLVYGFSHAESAGWGAPVTVGLLVAAGVLLSAFVLLQRRVAAPLLPLRVLLDRDRGGAFLAMFATAIGMFGTFLFLTYYLQATQHFSAVRSGLAFLPMVGVLVLSSTIVATRLATRVSARVLIPLGMVLAALGMELLRGITPTSGYAGHVLPGLLVMGLGMGTVFATAMDLAVSGVGADDAGVASALVNVMQQVGGSVGTALLNTLAATAATSYAAAHAATAASRAGLVQLAAVHSYVVAFGWSALVFAAAAVLSALVLRSGVARTVGVEAPAVVL